MALGLWRRNFFECSEPNPLFLKSGQLRGHANRNQQRGFRLSDASSESEAANPADDANADDPNADHANADDPNADDPNADDPNADHANADDPNADDPHADDPNADHANADHANADHANADDANADHANADHAGTHDAGSHYAGDDHDNRNGDPRPDLAMASSRRSIDFLVGVHRIEIASTRTSRFMTFPSINIAASRRLSPSEWIELGLLAALTGLASYGFHRVFATFMGVGRISGAAILAVAVVAFVELRAARLWVVATVSSLAMVLYSVYTQLADTMPFGVPGAATFRGLVDGLLFGWSDGLEALLPLVEADSTGVFLTYLAWLAGTVGSVLLFRSKQVLWTVVPALILYSITLPLSAPTANSGIWLPFLIAALTLALLAFRSNLSRTKDIASETTITDLAAQDFQVRTSPLAMARSALPLAVGCAAVGILVGSVIDFGSDDPFDPRDARPDTVRPEAIINPLAEFKAVKNQQPPALALQLGVSSEDDLAAIGRIPVAVLDSFDGAEWRSSARYRVSGPDLPGDRNDSAVLVVQDIVLGAVRGPWLPAAQHPVRISLESVLVDERTGTIVAPLGLEVSQYTVLSEVVIAAPADLRTAETDQVDGRYLNLPAQVPVEVFDLASALASDAPTSYDRVTSMVDYLQVELFADETAPPGHSLGRLQSFLFAERRGTAEQFASSLAVMLRTQGIPARLVVGYDLSSVGPVDADGLYAVTSDHYDVWVEVPFDGYGWQAFDPLPLETAIEPVVEETPGTTIPADSEQGVSPVPLPSETSPSQSLDDVESNSRFGAWLLPSLLASFFAVWVLGFVLLILWSKRRRRKRRKDAPTPVGRIEGAWADATDRLLEAGIDVSSELTLSEVAAAGAEEFGEGPSAPLRAMVPDVAANAYSMREPDQQAAERVWANAEVFRRQTAATRSRRKRVSEKLNPRPLVKNR